VVEEAAAIRLRRWRRSVPLPVGWHWPEMPMSTPTRRTFLQTAVAAAASLVLPRFLLAKGNPRSFWFLPAPTGKSWAVDNPVVWSLEHAHEPILERARERLVTLDAADPQRIIRVVVRRCALNLLELRPAQVVVHHWGQQGKGDLRPFIKQHGPARKSDQVALIDRKRETHHGPDRRCPPLRRATGRAIPARCVPGKVAAASHRGAGRLDACPVQRVKLLLGRGREHLDSLAGVEVRLAARGRTALPELRPAHPGGGVEARRTAILGGRMRERVVRRGRSQ
jgi:hypothetical protein